MRTAVLSFVVYVAASLQNVDFVAFENGQALKPIHLLVAVMLFLGIARLGLPYPLRPMAGFLSFALFVSLIAYLEWGFDALYFNYLFALLVLVAVGTLLREADYAEVLRGLRAAALVVAGYAAVNVVVHWDAVVAAHAEGPETGIRAEVPGMVYSGGVNIEASWIALAGLFFVRSVRQFAIYSAFSLIVQFAYASRTGAILFVLVGLVFVWTVARSGLRRVGILAGGVAALLLFAVLASEQLNEMATVRRFYAIGDEPGSIGRIEVMRYATAAFLERPIFGYGAGNEPDALISLGWLSYEDNIHNYLLGSAVSFGVVGPFVYIFAIYATILRNAGKLELLAYLLVFNVAALFEFRGADTVLYVVIALLATARLSAVEPPERIVATAARTAGHGSDTT